MILALFALYPVLVATVGFLTAGILVLSTSMNVVLTTLCVAFYMMIPRGSFDHWFASALDLVRMMAPQAYDQVVTNLGKTFQYVEHSPAPERAMYLWHPHGLFSVTPFLHSIISRPSRVACLSIFHRIPVVRDLYAFMGAIPSDYDTMKETLEHESISVIPGGVREMMGTEQGVMRLVLKGRTGVFRMALETGTPIVPVLTYGENELFPSIDSPMLRALNQVLYQNFRIMIPIPSLTSLLHWVQLSETPLPPVRSHVGRPLQVEKVEAPTPEDVRRLAQRYERRLRRLFAKTAPKGLRLVIEPSKASE